MNRSALEVREMGEHPVSKIRRFLTQRLFPPRLFLVKEIVIFRTSGVAPLVIADDGASVRWGTADDLSALEKINPGAAEHARLREEDWTCTIGFREGEPVSYLWFYLAACHVSRNNGFRFYRSPDTCWASNMFVRPDQRLLGAFHRHWVGTMSLLARRGIRHVYHTSNADNVHSVRSHVHLGSRILYHYRVVRLAGLVHHRATPAEGEDVPGSSGWGEWKIRIS